MDAARACKLLHHLKYDMGYRPLVTDDARAFGTLIHHGLESWWVARMEILDAPEVWLTAALARIEEEKADPYDLAKARAMLNAYHARWADVDLDVVAVEVPFDVPLLNPETGAASRTWRLRGKIDAIVRLPDGRLLLVEHKTAGVDVSPGSDYWTRLRLDGQVTVYYLGARAAGYDVEGCIYDVLVKPRQRPLKATPEESRKYKKDGTLYANQRDRDETPEEYFERVITAIMGAPDEYLRREMVVRLESEELDGLWDIWQTAKEIRAGQLANRHPRNPRSCFNYNRPCDFWPVCSGEASLDDPTRYERLDDVHPELATEAPARAEEVF
jgi:hypothetical protein